MTMSLTTRRLITSSLLAIAIPVAMVSGGCAAQGPVALDIEQRIPTARTEDDHLALAAAYERQANLDRQSSESHARSALSYEKSWSPPAPWSNATGKAPAGNKFLIGHCQDLARLYSQASSANLELAAAHRQAAAAARK